MILNNYSDGLYSLDPENGTVELISSGIWQSIFDYKVHLLSDLVVGIFGEFGEMIAVDPYKKEIEWTWADPTNTIPGKESAYFYSMLVFDEKTIFCLDQYFLRKVKVN